MTTAVLVAAGYVAGSMTWGYWLVRLFRGEDVRTKGSGNVGATNVWRVYGRDARTAGGRCSTRPRASRRRSPGRSSSGTAPGCSRARRRCSATGGRSSSASARAGRWSRPPAARSSASRRSVGGLAARASGSLVFALTRYASVASMAAAASLALWAWLFGYPWPVIAFGGCAGAAVLVLHRANIRRLPDGEENRFRGFAPLERRAAASP